MQSHAPESKEPNMTDTAIELTKKKCKPCEGGVAPMSETQIAAHLKALIGWKYANGVITRSYAFKNYFETMAFVNASAWISHREDHHPDLAVGYNTCRVDYSTHAIG